MEKIVLIVAGILLVAFGGIQLVNFQRAKTRQAAQSAMIQNLRNAKTSQQREKIIADTKTILEKNLSFLALEKQTSKAGLVYEPEGGRSMKIYCVGDGDNDYCMGGGCDTVFNWLSDMVIEDNMDMDLYIGASYNWSRDCAQ